MSKAKTVQDMGNLTPSEVELLHHYNRVSPSGKALMKATLEHFLRCQSEGKSLEETAATSPIALHLQGLRK